MNTMLRAASFLAAAAAGALVATNLPSTPVAEGTMSVLNTQLMHAVVRQADGGKAVGWSGRVCGKLTAADGGVTNPCWDVTLPEGAVDSAALIGARR